MQYTYPFSNTLTATGTVTRTKSIDYLFDCADSPFAPCCDCFPVDGQIMYFIAGDTFTYQLPFSPDSIVVYDFAGDYIGEEYNTWIDGTVITVDVDDIPKNIQCFYFQVFYRGFRYCFDFGFRRHGTKELDYCYGGDCGIGTITIESLYTKKDCHGNSYDSKQSYSNRRRFLAEVEYIGNVEEAKVIDGVRVSSKIYNQFQVRILQPLKQDKRLLKEFVEIIMRGKNPIITIDNGFPYDEIFCEDFTDTLARGYDSLRDWYPTFTVRSLECVSTLNCEI